MELTAGVATISVRFCLLFIAVGGFPSDLRFRPSLALSLLLALFSRGLSTGVSRGDGELVLMQGVASSSVREGAPEVVSNGAKLGLPDGGGPEVSSQGPAWSIAKFAENKA